MCGCTVLSRPHCTGIGLSGGPNHGGSGGKIPCTAPVGLESMPPVKPIQARFGPTKIRRWGNCRRNTQLVSSGGHTTDNGRPNALTTLFFRDNQQVQMDFVGLCLQPKAYIGMFSLQRFIQTTNMLIDMVGGWHSPSLTQNRAT